MRVVRMMTVVVVLAACSSSSSSENAIDERTCEIARDIARSFNVTDTVDESRKRVADLYSGYGQDASPALSSALRDWSAGMTSGDYHEAASGISAVDAACSSEGY